MSDQLDPKAVVLIEEYLYKKAALWGGIFGVTNLAALAGAFIYIFFILPSVATERTREYVDVEMTEEIKHIRELTRDVGEASAVERDRLRALVRENEDLKNANVALQKKRQDLENDLAQLSKTVSDIHDSLKQLSSNEKTLVDAAQLIKTLGENNTDVKELVSRIEAVVASNSALRKEIYGDMREIVTVMDVPKPGELEDKSNALHRWANDHGMVGAIRNGETKGAYIFKTAHLDEKAK